jgi:hypothetical protein
MSRTLAFLLALLILGLTSLALGGEATGDAGGGDAVLLRYRLEPGEAQVFEVAVTFNMQMTAAGRGAPQNASMDMTVRLPFSVRGTERCDDGTMLGDVRFHGFQMTMDTRQGRERLSVKADEQRLEVSRNDSKLVEAEWGSASLGSMPDLRKLLGVTLNARFSDRGEIVEITNFDSVADQLAGIDINRTLSNQVVYPEQAIRTGDTWQHELSQVIQNPATPGGSVTVKGRATYTVLERLTWRNRPCLKLGLEARFDGPQGDLRFEQTLTGAVYVDIATGVPLDSQLDMKQDVEGTVEGVTLTLKGAGTISASYLGGSHKYDELVNAQEAARAEPLHQLEIPMITGDRIRINGANYARGDLLNVAGEQYQVVAFKSTALKLHRQSDSAVYQLGISSEGRVTYVKLLGHAD